MQSTSRRALRERAWIGWIALVLIVGITVAWVFIPAWLIQPFKVQTRSRLSLSYALRHWSPLVTLLGIATASLVVLLFRRSFRGWWRSTGVAILFVPLLAVTWFSRQNHFEWMFKPLSNAAFATAGEAAFVADDEMVLAVEINGDAAAYPVRQVAYHHVAMDSVGGVPVVATY